MSIKQAIEALEMCRRNFLDGDKVDFKEWGQVDAALAALRSVPQGEPVDKQQEIDTITELNHAQWLALGKASLLIAACNRLSGEAEEFDFDDGLGRGAPQAYWDEFEDALEQAAEAIDVANKTIHQDHIATPPTAPVLTEAWQPIETAPKDGRTLLLGYFNSHGKWRTMRGRWYSLDTIVEEWEESDLAGEGWYETVVESDDYPNCWWAEPTHWMHLPPPPAAALAGDTGEAR